ncbi:AmmeMemoRadiSam system radical SAM enzyme [Thiocystis violacea]|uniref:AmmeMemoRadiSam system radical SAM enzyme n=1 Tax=Thiocystis violacea TaxID=13725 RepID=UPI00190727C7|nr:AmmeMemoRadiSam system radical SAM enzyme [Thiocystis violacea]MBK1720208.1 AmmeMemoRadiSam system radical SAM enzyme [Thiocystis violacea]
MKEARFYDRLDNKRVQCRLCPHDCIIPDAGRGVCAVRYNSGGTLFTLVGDRVVSRNLDPIEKKPLFHFHPGSTAYSIATVGCSLRCTFCQNWEISQWPRERLPKHLEPDGIERDVQPMCPQLARLGDRVPGEQVTPAQIVQAARNSGARAIAYTYTEPTIFYELAYETACLARKAGLANVFITNGYINEAPQREIASVLDAANVDLKFFREESYRHLSRVKLQPVLDAIRRYHELGVWLEVTTLVIPGVNDSDGELRDIAAFIHSVSPDIPWHVSRFHAAYEMRDIQATPAETLRRAAAIGHEVGLRYVYVGNLPGDGGENTDCHACGAPLIERHGFYLTVNRIRRDACPACGALVAGVGMNA